MSIARTPLFLMANLGSEVSRMLSALERGDADMARRSKKRADEILASIIEFPEMQPRKRELLLLKNVIEGFFDKNSEFKVRSNSLKEYFIPFALRAMPGM